MRLSANRHRPISVRRALVRRAHAGSRGFTLIEMMAVLALIGIVVAAAAPSWVEIQRDRRTDAAARAIADIYRIARSRALGRGSAVMVRWNANATLSAGPPASGHFTVRE